MGPYEYACDKISDIIDEFDLSKLPHEDILNASINDLTEAIEDFFTALQKIKGILDNIGGL